MNYNQKFLRARIEEIIDREQERINHKSDRLPGKIKIRRAKYYPETTLQSLFGFLREKMRCRCNEDYLMLISLEGKYLDGKRKYHEPIIHFCRKCYKIFDKGGFGLYRRINS